MYERLLLSNDKEAVLEVAREERIPEKVIEIIKDPMVLEFLGLENKPAYREIDLESALIQHLESFLLELGNDFTFVARQKRITLEDDELVKYALPEDNQTVLASKYQLLLPTEDELLKQINEVESEFVNHELRNEENRND